MPDSFQHWAELGTLIGVSGVVLVLLHLISNRDRRVVRRMEQFADNHTEIQNTHARDAQGFIARLLQRILPKFSAHLLPDDQAKRSRLQARLQHAGINDPLSLQIYVFVRLLLVLGPLSIGVAAVVTGMAEMKYGLLLGTIGGAVGTVLPGLWLDGRKAKRQLTINRSLPDFLDILVTCLESGLSLEGALRRVTSELRLAHPVLAGEMERVQQETELGVTTDAALQNLAERTDVDSIRMLGTFMQQARRFGTSVNEALRTHGDMLRDQREQRAEELAQKAAVKILFPTLLFIFPSVFVVLAGPAAIQLNEKFANPAETSTAHP